MIESFPNTVPLPKPSQVEAPPMSRFWMCAWSFTLAFGWLLPNHYPPWSTFHLDAWVATAFLLSSAAVFLRSPGPTTWTGLSLVLLFLAFLPALQYAFGLVTMAGNAWVSTAYLLGLLLALLTGARWASVGATQPVDALFLAIGMGAVVSVGLQLHQWLGLDRLDIWSMGEGYGRPFANFGQPNQLATFLIWGLLATLWGLVRRHIGAKVAICLALFLLFGLALTASRTAWVALVLLVLATWLWRGLWSHHRVPVAVSFLALAFVSFVVSIGWLTRIFTGGALFDAGSITRISGESRPQIWGLFMDGVLQRPWWGYGWSQISLAQMEVAVDHPPLHVFFSHAHNLFLDLVLACGVPIGLSVSVALLWWCYRRVRLVRRAEEAVLVLFLLVVANHAMLELPLHYAYFLLPTGFVAGVLEVRLGSRAIFHTGRWVLAVLWLLSAMFLSMIVRDYMLVEASYKALRFEWANIKTEPAKAPEVLVLSQWRDFFRMIRLEPSQGMAGADLAWMRNVTGLYPSAGFFQKLATAMALNQRPNEAALSLRQMCRVVSERQCQAVKAAWENRAKTDPLIAKVPWPN